MKTKKVIIYHHSDPDGWSAASIIADYYKDNTLYDVNFKEVNYGDKYILDINNKLDIIYVVDFSFPDMENLSKYCKNLIWIDHHKSSQSQVNNILCSEKFDHVYIKHDTLKSGSLLTWEYFYPLKPAPDLIQYINDYDLWLFKYSTYTKAVHEYLVQCCGSFLDYNNLDIKIAIDIGMKLLEVKTIKNLKSSKNWSGIEIIMNHKNQYYDVYMINKKVNSEYFGNASNNITSLDINDPTIYCCYEYNHSKKYYSISLYRHKDSQLDLTEIFSGFKGHPGACGANCKIFQKNISGAYYYELVN